MNEKETIGFERENIAILITWYKKTIMLRLKKIITNFFFSPYIRVDFQEDLK